MFARHGAKYVGYEISDDRVALARKTAEKAGVLELVEFRVGDFMQLEETFDYVFVKSVLYHIWDKETYRMWLEKINSLLNKRGKFIALENGIGVSVNRWIRKKLLRRNYVDCLLYSPVVEQMFRETFAEVNVRYFYVWSHLTPCPRLCAKLESFFVKPNARNCFIASLICDRK
jgi:ubiquinone/menaquinone biosynthesis C-methylase UbiE